MKKIRPVLDELKEELSMLQSELADEVFNLLCLFIHT
jgi:hypothetical protein